MGISYQTKTRILTTFNGMAIYLKSIYPINCFKVEISLKTTSKEDFCTKNDRLGQIIYNERD